MLTHIPRDIPLFLAVAAGLGLVTYGFTELNTTARPSSTSALAYFFIPLWSLVFASVAFAVGLAVRVAWRRISPEKQVSTRYWWVLPSSLVIVLISTASFGVFRAVHAEKEAQPAVLVDSGRLERVYTANVEGRIREATLVFHDKKPPVPIVWGSNSSELVVGDSQAQIRDHASSRKAVVSTAALDYITQVHAVPIALAQYTQPGLAIVITGRATGRRAVLVVLAPDYEVLLEERLVRFWDLQSIALEVRTDHVNGDEAIVVGPGCEKSLAIRSRKAVQPARSRTTPTGP
jgi:hypothetical protein